MTPGAMNNTTKREWQQELSNLREEVGMYLVLILLPIVMGNAESWFKEGK